MSKVIKGCAVALSLCAVVLSLTVSRNLNIRAQIAQQSFDYKTDFFLAKTKQSLNYQERVLEMAKSAKVFTKEYEQMVNQQIEFNKAICQIIASF